MTKLNELSRKEKDVILFKGTEMPFSGKYDDFDKKGTYICKQCNAPLYRSDSKFDARCGWPAFDDEIPGAIKHIPITYGPYDYEEIQCNTCNGHLGHLFIGEGFTQTNKRHCVNSISLQFVPYEKSDE